MRKEAETLRVWGVIDADIDNLTRAFEQIHRLDKPGRRELEGCCSLLEPADSVTMAAALDHCDECIVTCRPGNFAKAQLAQLGVHLMTASQLLKRIGEEDARNSRKGPNGTLGAAMLSHMAALGVTRLQYEDFIRAAELDSSLCQYIP